MSHKFGFPAMTNRATNGSNLKNPKKSQKPNLFRVTDIIMDENHPRVKSGEFKWPSCMGLVICVGTSPINFGKELTALPLNTNSKNFPVVNEYVDITRGTIPNSNGTQYFYDKPIALYGSTATNGNFFPSTTQTVTPPSQNLDYTQVGNGAVNVISNQPQQIQTSSPDNPSQATFTEKSDIHPLMPFEGDILREGRFGNSLRFGSTSKSNSQWKNNWSTSGENGDPITILRNGQPVNSGETPGYLPVVEDINKDLSSIYLTSYQKIPFNSSPSFNSYLNKPTKLGEYISPQTIINSSRVVLRATDDHVIILGKQSINLYSERSINIDSPTSIIQSTNIFLGDKEATEPGIKGDVLYNKLDTILQSLIDLITVLEVQQIWPAGLPSPDGGTMMVASITKQQLINTKNTLDDIKSKVVKLK
jgi:hypothetical protein